LEDRGRENQRRSKEQTEICQRTQTSLVKQSVKNSHKEQKAILQKRVYLWVWEETDSISDSFIFRTYINIPLGTRAFICAVLLTSRDRPQCKHSSTKTDILATNKVAEGSVISHYEKPKKNVKKNNTTLQFVYKLDVRGSVHHGIIHKEKSNKMQQCIKILLFHTYMKLNTFRVTPPTIRSLKLHWLPLVFHTWKVVGRVVSGLCQAQYLCLTTFTNSMSNNLPHIKNQRFPVQF